jgi:CheY-like chemotaxis protein
VARIRLLHWNAAEAAEHLAALRRAKHKIDYEANFDSSLMKAWRASPPDAFVIDLSRLPSHGREIAIALRQSPRTRHVPIVFVNGAVEKVERIRSELPDAIFCPLLDLIPSLAAALEHRTADPARPVQMMDRYAGRSTAQKLGITEGTTVAAFAPPGDYPALLGPLPPRVEFVEEETAAVTLYFAEDQPAMARELSHLRRSAAKTKLWVLWRKGGKSARGQVTEPVVRETGLLLGLVDYKICSVNPIWSAMLFALKR